MNKLNISKVFSDIKEGASKHSPEILTGLGIAGMMTTTVLAVTATPKALQNIENEKRFRLEDFDLDGEPTKADLEDIKLSPIEIIKVSWKPYIPAIAMCGVSTACLIGASSVNAKRNAALATAYQLSRTALIDYKEKVVETIGEKKEKTIQEKVHKEKLEKDPVSSKEVFITGDAEHLCYDVISGRYFKSSLDKIKRAQNELNKKLMDEMYISLNEFYDELGLPCNKLGNELGWNISDGFIDMSFDSNIAENGEPCIVVDYCIAPRFEYDKLL